MCWCGCLSCDLRVLVGRGLVGSEGWLLGFVVSMGFVVWEGYFGGIFSGFVGFFFGCLFMFVVRLFFWLRDVCRRCWVFVCGFLVLNFLFGVGGCLVFVFVCGSVLALGC